MVKFRDAGDGAAYEIADGVDAKQAAELGLAVVESRPDGTPMHWGRYKGAPDGGPLGVTVDKPADTVVIAAGATSAPAPEPAPVVTNLNDPVVKTPPGVDTIHADGSPPGKFEDEIGVIPQEAPSPRKGK